MTILFTVNGSIEQRSLAADDNRTMSEIKRDFENVYVPNHLGTSPTCDLVMYCFADLIVFDFEQFVRGLEVVELDERNSDDDSTTASEGGDIVDDEHIEPDIIEHIDDETMEVN
eukprot:6931876-Heterocapsa_arctica.AAC.1